MDTVQDGMSAMWSKKKMKLGQTGSAGIGGSGKATVLVVCEVSIVQGVAR